MSEKNMDSLREKLANIVDEPNVISRDEHLSDFMRSNVDIGEKPIFVIKPQSEKQVGDLIELARDLHVNIVPVSSGAPHMKGGALVDKKGVVVDLSDMKNIRLINRRNKVALIEPGVTYGQLKDEADKHNLKVLTPLLPKANKSVLASYLERDPILIPKYHWDMTDPMLCSEIIFGSGRFYRTGSAGGPGTIEQKIEAKTMFKNPLGPGQTDLMRVVQGAQGTMGIVTWASVKMEVKPGIHRMYFVSDDKLERLIDFSYRVLRPKLADEFLILNKHTFAAITAKNPADIPKMMEAEKNYVVAYGVSGYDLCPEERVAFTENDIETIAQQAGVKIANAYMGVSGSKFSRIIAQPSAEPYYRNAVKGGFVDVHFLSTMDKAGKFIDVMTRCASEQGYSTSELGVYIQPILFGRACHIEFSLYYDPEDSNAAKNIKKLHEEASRELAKAGAFYSRPYGYWSDLAYARCNDTVTVLKQIKEMFDPDYIMNQGKLVYKEVV